LKSGWVKECPPTPNKMALGGCAGKAWEDERQALMARGGSQ
jgi:hypothetical protein